MVGLAIQALLLELRMAMGFVARAVVGMDCPGLPVWEPLLETLSGAKLAEVVMVNNKGTVVLASPSAPSSTELGFCVADGPTAPQPPN